MKKAKQLISKEVQETFDIIDEADYYVLTSRFKLSNDAVKREFVNYLKINYKDLLDYMLMGPHERRMITHGSGKYGETFTEPDVEK